MSQANDQNVKKYFTNPDDTLEKFDAFTSSYGPQKHLFVIHGMGGVGKSSLLCMFREVCKEKKIPVGLVSNSVSKKEIDILAQWASDLKEDGAILRNFSMKMDEYRRIQAKVKGELEKLYEKGIILAKPVIDTVLSAYVNADPILSGLIQVGTNVLFEFLRNFLSKPEIDLILDPLNKLTEQFIEDISKISADQRLVLMLDTFEKLTTLKSWIRDMIQKLPSHVLVVIAGRVVPDWNKEWPGWQNHAETEVHELKPMTDEVMRKLIYGYYAFIHGGEPDQEQVVDIIRCAKGLPLAATTAVNILVKFGFTDFKIIKPAVLDEVVECLIEGVSAQLKIKIQYAAVLRWFNKESLRAVVGSDDIEAIYRELISYPFVRPQSEGFAFHDTAREIIEQKIRKTEPLRYCLLHQRATKYYESVLRNPGVTGPIQYQRELLYHLFLSNQKKGTQLFQTIAEELSRHQFAGKLKELLDDVLFYVLPDPGIQENNKQWCEYYSARLAYLERRYRDAEEIYNRITQNPVADRKLNAYVLCDWGKMIELQIYESLNDPKEKRANLSIARSIELLNDCTKDFRLDNHLCESYLSLARVLRYQLNWADEESNFQKALNYYKKQKDYYGVARVYAEKKKSAGRRGLWRIFIDIYDKGNDAIKLVSREPDALAASLFGEWVWSWSLMGRFSECERKARKSLEIAQRQEDKTVTVRILRDLMWSLGFQGKYDEAKVCYGDAIRIIKNDLKDFVPLDEARIVGFWGMVLTKQGKYDEAKEPLEFSLKVHQETGHPLGMPQRYSQSGYWEEVQCHWDGAISHYRHYTEWKEKGFFYGPCLMLAGLIRVKYAQGLYAELPELIQEAEAMAREYEYNDVLASLRLTQGHIAWNRILLNGEDRFETVFRCYSEALVYGLRYNRFMLDEILWGGESCTPLIPILTTCKAHGNEGHNILNRLKTWWQIGTNRVEKDCMASISLSRIGMSLLQAEAEARQREMGRGNLQKTVIEVLN